MDANQITDRLNCLGRRLAPFLVTVALVSCTAAAKLSDMASAPLEYVGLIKSSADDAKTTAQAAKDQKEAAERAAIKNVKISLFAGRNLNSDASGQGLALVTRIYTLRDPVAMQQSPYESFIAADGAASAFDSDVVKSREIVLTPGQRIDVSQEIASDVTAIAIVALFRNPAPTRWRLVFNIKDAAKEGIVVGANACALTVTSGLSGVDADGRSLQLLPPQCPR